MYGIAFIACALLCLFGSNGIAGPTDVDNMMVIPAGHFMMGSTPAEATRDKVAPEFAALQYPQHAVSVPSFLLAKHDVTRGEFAAFVTATAYVAAGCNVWNGFTWTMVATASWKSPGFDQTDRDPVVCVSLADVDAYARWYSQKMGRTFRLPSEAEWEYAARAGRSTSRYWGDDSAQQCTYANGSSLTYGKKFPQEPDINRACADGYVYTSPVGSFQPNAWGLYDMLGDAWQWTSDCAHKGYDGAPADGSAWMTGKCTSHFYRGGSWYDGPWLLRAATRNGGKTGDRYNGVGFRLAASVP
jgi:formylglycine-generating enzyme required for sulfatase activity